jgi:dipeptidyl aminopeptidase/acylaminoacyl peptidase
MLFPNSRHPMLRSYRSLLAPLLALTVSLAFGACGGDDTPLAPADPSSAPDEQAGAPVEQAAAPDLTLATTGQRLLFSSSRKGGYDIFRMDPQGYNVVPLTSFGWYGSEPSWSYDNKRVALIRPRKDAANVEHADIYLMNADGTNKHWARSTPSGFDIRFPSWSSDGVHLAVALFFGGKPFLATMDVTNGNLAFVLLGGKVIQGNYPSYDRTGKKILYVDATGKIIQMIDPIGDVGYWMIPSTTVMSSPRFSPDGTKIAFARVVGSNVDIYVRTLYPYTNIDKRLTFHAAYDGSPTWSPDGSRIAFESTRSGTSQIWVMNAATGGSLIRITHTSTQEKYPAWSH